MILNVLKVRGYLILRFWGDDILRGFIFAISKGKYEKGALNFTTQALSISFKFSIFQILIAARDIS